MSTDGQGTKKRRNIAVNFNRLSIGRTNVTDRRQADGRAIAYSERERAFTLAKNCWKFASKWTTANNIIARWWAHFALGTIEQKKSLREITNTVNNDSSIAVSSRTIRRRLRADAEYAKHWRLHELTICDVCPGVKLSFPGKLLRYGNL